MDWVKNAEMTRHEVRNFIDGRWSEVGGELSDKLSPRDGRLLCRVGAGESGEVEDAVKKARRAFDDGRWSELPIQRRKDVMHKLAALIEGNKDSLALLECLDVGKPISEALAVDVPAAAEIIRFNAEGADKVYGRVYGVDRASLSYQLYRPVGVVAAIVGWNFPLLLAATKIAPALATGNSVVLKPSELTSFTAARLAELAVEAGVPEGVFNVIHGGAHIGATLVRQADVDLATFTGSTQTGKKLLIAAGESNMKRLVLECGGKSPNIVFDDGLDLEVVADAVLARAFYNQGQVCTASSRLLIQESIKDELLSTVIRKASALALGDPLSVETKLGAVVSLGHRQKILNYVESGEKEGARKVYQSNAAPPYKAGFYVAPVIFDNVSPSHRISQEEIFGPVLSVMTFRDEDEAVQIANRTIYGLSAILWTKDVGRAHRVTRGVKVGWMVVNATDKPFGGCGIGIISVGGHKQSGVGSEGGLEGLEEYTTKTAVQIFV